MSDQSLAPMYDTKYKCPKCGRKWRAFDDIIVAQTCSCGYVCVAFDIKYYNLKQVKFWDFCDQVKSYPKEGIAYGERT